MPTSGKSETITEGIKIEVTPEYIPQQSYPDKNEYLFAYTVVITNTGDKWAKLVSRHWIIINADGDLEEVQGPGVVGYTPELAPGQSFEYTSFCPLNTNWGTMEGTYKMVRNNGDTFDAKIERFYLFVPELIQSP
jgi:ApaG protein